jgi:GAF domain-containing protein
MGLMFANYRTHQVFRENQQELIELFAKQAAIAIKNARMDQRLKILEEIGKKLTSSARFREHEILELIYTESSSVTDTRNMFIALFEESTDTLQFKLVVKDSKRDKNIEKRWENRRAGKGKSDWIIRNKKPLLFNTRNEIRDWYNQPEHEKPEGALLWNSWLGVPMMVENKVFGVIAIRHPDIEHAFDENDVRVLSSIGSQAAIAIDNARLYYNVNQRQKALIEIGEKLTTEIRLSEKEILELIYGQASEKLKMVNLSIALYDEITDTISWALAVVNGKQVDIGNVKGWETRSAGKGKTGKIIKSKKYLLLPSIKEVKKAKFSSIPNLPPPKDDVIPNCWLGVPMMVGNKVLGVIANYDYGKNYVYDDDYRKILQALANQAAIAISNSRIYDRSSELNKRQQALVEFGSKLGSKIPYGETVILEFIHKQADKFMDTNNMYIALYDDSTDTVQFGMAFVKGKRIDVKTNPAYQPRKAGEGRTEEIIRTKKSLFHPTEAKGQEWYAQPGRKEYVGTIAPSWMGVPMMLSDNKVIGVVATFHPNKDNVYSEEDLDILQSMADLAAIALENARLYEEAQKLQDEKIAAEQLATLGTATAALQHRINNTFNIIVPNVLRLRSRVDPKDKTISEILDIIERNARQTSKIIGRIQDPLKEIEEQDININSVIQDVIYRIKEQREPSKVEVKLKLSDPLPLIKAPIGQITEIFTNLIENAYKAMPLGGILTIESYTREKTISVEVQDTGTGIPKDVQRRLFKEPVPSQEPNESSGLGLWLSRLILQRISGSIKIKGSDSTGTTMLVQIPYPLYGKGGMT